MKAEAQIIQTTHCRVALPLILGVELFQSDRYLTDSADPLPDQRHHSRGKTHQPHLLEDGFESVSFEANKPFSTDKFQRFLEQLPNSVFRAKGVLWIDEGYHRYIFHLVGKRFTLDETGLSSPMRNRLALIGQNLDHKALHDQLEGCLCDIGGGA